MKTAQSLHEAQQIAGITRTAQPSIKLAAGVYFETPAGYGAVGATTGQALTAREW